MFKVICSEKDLDDINLQISKLYGIESVSRPSLIYTNNYIILYKVCIMVEFFDTVNKFSN